MSIEDVESEAESAKQSQKINKSINAQRKVLGIAPYTGPRALEGAAFFELPRSHACLSTDRTSAGPHIHAEGIRLALFCARMPSLLRAAAVLISEERRVQV